MNVQKPVQALGWFSIALGVAEIVAPKRIGSYLGMPHRANVLRAYGVREIASGVGILARRDPVPGLWARVGGDLLDLATLGSAVRSRYPRRDRAGLATGAIAAITAVDIAAARLAQTSRSNGRETDVPADEARIERWISIGKSPHELYALWKDPRTINQVMGHAAAVTSMGDGRMGWTVERGPLGRDLQWETSIVEDVPDGLIRWETVPESNVTNSGTIAFRAAPGEWGTEVTLSIALVPPSGPLGGVALRLAGPLPDLMVGKALRRFKSLAETGEIPVLDRQPAARKGGRDD